MQKIFTLIKSNGRKLAFLLACLLIFLLLFVRFDDYRKAQIGFTDYHAAEARVDLTEGVSVDYSLEQPSFAHRKPFIVGLDIPLGISADNGSVKIELIVDGDVTESWELQAASIEDGQYHQLPLTSQLDPSGHDLSLRFTAKGRISLFTYSGGLCYREICSLSMTARLPFLLAFAGCIIFFVLLAVLLMKPAYERPAMALMLVCFSFAYLLACPNATGPDDPKHFYRSFEIAEGGLVSERLEGGYSGAYLPSALADVTDPRAEIDFAQRQAFDFSNLALYSPVNYLPQAIGIRLVLLFTRNVPAVYMAGRVSCLLFCLVLCIAALWILPFGRRAFFLALMLPMSQQLLASMSADAPTTALAFFFVSMVLSISFSEKTTSISRKQTVLLCLAAVMLSMCKIVYVALLPILFLIPLNAAGTSRKSLWIRSVILLGFCAVLNLIWLSVSSTYLVRLSGTADSSAQAVGILLHPIAFIEAILRTVNGSTAEFAAQMAGSQLGRLDVSTTPVAWITMIAMLIYEASRSRSRIAGKHDSSRIVLLLSVLGACLLIFTSLYVQWTDVAARDIVGIQGRYFIPLLPALIALFSLSSAQSHQEECLPRPSLTVFTAAVMNGLALFDLCTAYHLI